MSEIKLPPLGRSELDRDYLSRLNPDLFDSLWENPLTRVVAMHSSRVLLEGFPHSPKLRLFEVSEVPSATLRVYLGKTISATNTEPSGSPIVLAVLGDNAAKQLEPDSESWHTLRKTGFGLSDRDAGIFTQGLAIANWHLTSAHCPGCGTPTVIEQGGWVRRCLKDGTEIFPRTDPAVIVAIEDQHQRILLGSQGAWEENRWSILAGFVEPGESLEAAVIREMKEESGLSVSNPKYLYSQSWPYPYSLMLGFTASADSSEPLAPDGEEIVKLRWFSKTELAEEAKNLLLPNRSTISRALIENWYGGALTSAEERNGDGQQ